MYKLTKSFSILKVYKLWVYSVSHLVLATINSRVRCSSGFYVLTK